MEDKFKWHLGNFMSEMQTTAFRNYKETDECYIEIEQYLKKNEEKFNKIINSLPDKDKRFIKEYMDKECHLASSVSENLYLSGYKDCVKLLREFGVV